jgi:peptidoglycan/LPS O-acetylase OafA/YrhL
VLDVDSGGRLQQIGETDASGLHLMPGMLRAMLVVGGVMLSPGIQRLLSNAVSDFLGRISFGVYLLHAPVLWSLGGLTFLPLATRFGLLPAALTASLAVVAVACLAAALFHRLVERPAMRLAGRAGRLVAGLGMTGADRGRETRRKPA